MSHDVMPGFARHKARCAESAARRRTGELCMLPSHQSVGGDRDCKVGVIVVLAFAFVQQARHRRVPGVQQMSRDHACRHKGAGSG